MTRFNFTRTLLTTRNLSGAFLFLSLFLIGNVGLKAQRTCGTVDHFHQQAAEDPHLLQIKQQIEHQIQAYVSQYPQGASNRNLITIPVVFHVIHDGDAVGTSENISDALIQAQINQLNLDFRALNTDFANVPAEFQSVAGDTEIEFCLASKDPNGNATTGINRYNEGQPTYTKNYMTGTIQPNTIWNRNQYMNIWTCRFGNPDSGLLGFAQFPGGPASTDGIVIRYQSIGSILNPNPEGFPYHLGRTGTHEVGHWLGLNHIWGDNAAGCSGSDFVDDTPSQNSNYASCPSHPQSSCSSNDMFMNYMDYVNDNCMVMFTAGQKARMEAIINSYRSSLYTSAATNCNIAAPTPEINFVLTSKDEDEGSSCDTKIIDIDLSISDAPSSDVTVNLSLSGSASYANDYIVSGGSVTFPSGSTDNQTISLTIYEDGVIESDEEAILSLSTSSSDATIGNDDMMTINIMNDDDAPNSATSVIQTDMNTTAGDEQEFGPNETIHFHDPATGNIICSVRNLSSHDYGCTTVEVDRAGTGASEFANADPDYYLHSKSIMINPEFENLSGQYEITLYYTAAEVAGWEATTSFTRNEAWLHKVSGTSVTAVNSNNAQSYTISSKLATVNAFGSHVSYTATFDTGFSGFGVGVMNSSLPVELLSFDGRHIANEKNELTWITESEINSSHFEIERSTDLVNFETIGEVEAAGNSIENSVYQFSDFAYPYGISYYRLKMVDLDGTFEYSNTVSIVVNKQKDTFIYPNPSTGKFVLTFKDVQDEQMDIKVWNVASKLIKETNNITLNSRFHEVDLTGEDDGIYFIHVNAGGQSQSYKIVKISK